ncbi:MAG: lysostaphin resistance A-like protein [Planctomycetota bacterium]
MIARAAWLLVRLRIRRLLNMFGSGFRFRKPRPTEAPRRLATAPKRRSGALGLLVALAMIGYGIGFAVLSVKNVTGGFSLETNPFDATPRLIFLITLHLLVAFLVGLGTKELSAPEWDLEWLATLPLPMRSLLSVRVVERTLVNPVGWLLIAPFLATLAWGQVGWAAPLWGLLLALPLLAIQGALRVVVDTGLRLSLSPARLRNLQALISIVGLVVFYLGISAGTAPDSFVLDWAEGLAPALHLLPTAEAVLAATTESAGSALVAFGLLLLQAAAVAMVSVWCVGWWLRGGIVSSGARESGRHDHRARRGNAALPGAASAGVERRRWLSPVQARELRLLGRDRNFLVQTLVLPTIILGAQFLFNPGLATSFGDDLSHLGALAFGFGAYTLMFSAFQTLNAEGSALWILWSMPVSLEQVLREKARLWGRVALILPLALMAAGLALRDEVPLRALWVTTIVLAGIPICAVLATCLGIFGCDPLEQDVRRRIRPTYSYLYFLLASVYSYAIYARTTWEQLACMTLSALMAMALWQKARDRLPYLLDPTAAPPSRVAVADGLAAALLFFVLQGVVGLAVPHKTLTESPGQVMFLAFAAAGLLTAGGMRLVFARLGTQGVPRLLGETGFVRALVPGLVTGLLAAAVGLLYLYAIQGSDFFREAFEKQAGLGSAEFSLWWFLPLAVIAAPLFEEFIFRGLIFGGLRRSQGLWPAALASAAIFAIVHPPVSVLPVFVMGFCAALAYERTGALLAPMIAHAVYNLIVILSPWSRGS